MEQQEFKQTWLKKIKVADIIMTLFVLNKMTGALTVVNEKFRIARWLGTTYWTSMEKNIKH